MAFKNGLLGNYARGSAPPFLWRGTLQVEQTGFLLFFFFYGPLVSIIKTCSNEDVRSESHQEINSELNEALVLWKLIGN